MIFFKVFLSVLILFLSSLSFSQNNYKYAYKIFDSKGNELSYYKMLKVLKMSDVILFGELHNNPIDHWLELSLLKDMDSNKVIAGAEMFKASDQSIIDNYLAGRLSSIEFEAQAELWNNYPTDYKPSLDYSAKAGIPFIATNCDRKLARLVAKKGLLSLDSLSPDEKNNIAPLPIVVDMNLPGYKQFLEMEAHGHQGAMKGEFMAQAQALKDATMAYTIASNYKSGFTFLHFNGSYHSDNYEGIGWYLKRYKSELKIKTIATVEQNNLDKLNGDYKGKADFIIVVPADMTKTY